MKKQPITHLIIDAASSNEFDSGDCDYCLIEMTAEYVAYLLGYMDEVRRLHRADKGVYAIECWDASPRCFRFNAKLQELRDIDGDLAADIPRGEPILLTADPGLDEEDFQRVECQTVQVTNGDVWWTAYVKHSSIRIESAQIQKKTLLRIQRSLGIVQRGRPAKPKPSHPAIRRIHDLLYLDMREGRRRLPGPTETSTGRFENVEYTLCKHCDHFVEANEPPEDDTDKFLHLEDGRQEFDHAAEPSAQVHTLAQWRKLRPDLFQKHRDGRIGPNSKFHSRPGKLE